MDKKRFFNKRDFVFFWAALAAFALAFGARHAFMGGKSPEKFVQEVQEGLAAESEAADLILTELKSKIESSDKLNFANLLSKQKYPFFVYSNKKIVFWSDYAYEMDYYSISGFFVEKCIPKPIQKNNRKGDKENIYLARKKFAAKGTSDYELVCLVPLYTDYSYTNDYLKETFNPYIFPDSRIKINLDYDLGTPVKSAFDKYLFSIEFPEAYSYGDASDYLVVVFTAVGFCLLLIQVFFSANTLVVLGRYWPALGLIAGFCFLSRWWMLANNFPSAWLEMALFSYKDFYLSDISPSVGDLFLNLLAVMFPASFAFKYFRKLTAYRFIKNTRSPWWRAAIVVFWMTASYWALVFEQEIIRAIFENPRSSIDITRDISISLSKTALYLVFTFSVALYFMLSHIASQMAFRLLGSRRTKFAALLFSIGLAFVLSLVGGIGGWWLPVLHGLFIGISVVFGFFKTLTTPTFKTFIYLFSCALVGAAAGAVSIGEFSQTRTTNEKSRVALKLLEENDYRAEGDLSVVEKEIAGDKMIEQALLGPFTSPDVIVRKIRRQYLGRKHFDKYDVSIKLFDGTGNPHQFSLHLDTIRQMFDLEKYSTNQKNLYFINDLGGNQKNYLKQIPIERKGKLIGYVLLELKLKKIIPNSIYPSLLLDKEEAAQYDDNKYNYAVYSGKDVIFSLGNYYYDPEFLNLFKPKDAEGKETRINEIQKGGFHHYCALSPETTRAIIISSPLYPIQNILANFSFLFIILVGAILTLTLFFSFVTSNQKMKLNFATRIQIYLNIAFFFPLIVISIVITSVLSNANQREAAQSYVEKAVSVSTNLAVALDKLEKKEIGKEQLSDFVSEFGKLTHSDVNFYNEKGRLVVASQPDIFEGKLISELANPNAVKGLYDDKQNQIVLSESIGKLNYNTAYAGVKSFETGEVLGMVGLSFFESEFRYNEQIIDVITNIMNIFTTMFIVLLTLSYIVSHRLTEPLKMLTQRIKMLSLGNKNEPLQYTSEDEIGLLVGAYNQMLIKLEESKNALATSEKESAWREMAKQVAHEIKNPLTPMKLTLQQLQRITEPANERFHRSFKTLLAQIDILSDIATSFSAFAKMPVPKNEVFDLVVVLAQTANLYEDESIQIVQEIEKTDARVLADEKLMGRVFTNLILNGIQAVPSSRQPEIYVSLKKQGDFVLVQIKDNGAGIAEEVRPKVFIPNFSTKYTGSGIGLAVAKRGIEQAGGSIWFETEEGAGTSFFIKLPVIG